MTNIKISLVALLLGLVGVVGANTKVTEEVTENGLGKLTIHRVMMFDNKVHHWGVWED